MPEGQRLILGEPLALNVAWLRVELDVNEGVMLPLAQNVGKVEREPLPVVQPESVTVELRAALFVGEALRLALGV